MQNKKVLTELQQTRLKQFILFLNTFDRFKTICVSKFFWCFYYFQLHLHIFVTYAENPLSTYYIREKYKWYWYTMKSILYDHLRSLKIFQDINTIENISKQCLLT